MDFALFALLRNKFPNFDTPHKELSCMKLPAANRETTFLGETVLGHWTVDEGTCV